MPSADVRMGVPLIRFPTLFPGQMGVPGSDTERGLRTHVTGTVFYVDPNYVDNDDRRDGTDPEAPLTTVAAALTKCEAYRGDVILVMANGAWTYAGPNDYDTAIRESVIVTVPGVRIIGVAPFSPIGMPWMAALADGWCITVQACDVSIEGFGFVGIPMAGDSNGIMVEWGGLVYGDNVIVRNCYFSEDVDTAIQLEYVWHGLIEACEFDRCDTGIYLDPAGDAADYCEIRNNIFRDCVVGAVWAPGLSHSQVHHNSVFNSNAQGAGAATDEGIITTDGALAVGAANMVYENWLSCLLPVPAVGDYNDLCSASPTDAWINNHCMDGPTVTNPT